MTILYYSTSFYANHGGSVQSIEFYENLDHVKAVDKKILFPERKVKRVYSNVSNNFLRRFLRRISLLQILFFYRRNNFHLKNLKKKIKDSNPDVIIFQMDSNFLQIGKIKESFPEKLVCTQINGSPFDEPFKNIAFKNYFLKNQRESYENSDLNFFISEFSRERVMGGAVDYSRDVVIYNGTDPQKFFPIKEKKSLREKWKFPVENFILGYIGTLDFHKQIIDLIEVFYELDLIYHNLFLVIIGDGPAFAKIQDRIRNLRLEDKIQMTGWIDHQYINENINCFDLAVHHYASNYMNPLKIFEFLAAGLPVLAPDIPSVRNTFKDKEDLLLTGSEKGELKQKLELMISDNNLRKKLSSNQYLIKNIEKNYTWKRYAERIVSQMQEKLNEKDENIVGI
ncbi:glycosyltransferase family 4 protein [Zunongwangia sp. F260]|uniref:Glycosyltransferase family 4 protein n=1 Tax=Autumnicola lenta TaxID=3075593 RepID=A0ABU3CMK2_9FLAO|nr:glycosyltransferase family 4 protein [Zunongwangia sp. F260]MDT0647588.1 glycosyltransferase family 4 protein [Zunongwangia sp. F260]